MTRTPAAERFWALTRHTAAALSCTDAIVPTTVCVPKCRDDLPAHSLRAALDALATKRPVGMPRKRGALPTPLPLRVHETDPRCLTYPDDVAVGVPSAEAAADAFMDRTATAHEWRVALNAGAARFFRRFPQHVLATPALVEALVAFVTRDEVLRPRTRRDANAASRDKTALARDLLNLLSHAHRNDADMFTPAVVGAALASLGRPKAKPRHVRLAFRVLLLAPAHVVARHPLVDHLGVAVGRLKNATLVALAERLSRRVAHPDALDLFQELRSALGDGDGSGAGAGAGAAV
jgi:hypothetical protein